MFAVATLGKAETESGRAPARKYSLLDRAPHGQEHGVCESKRLQAQSFEGVLMNANRSSSGKTHKQENFPVASWLVRVEHRPVILAFYRFARAADDVADDPAYSAEQKTARLAEMESSLVGNEMRAPDAVKLGKALRERGLSLRHALDLLGAFRLDVSKTRYASWDELMSYCAQSAMPVGRFVLDVHGESAATWAASDSICAALQIINHLQDCGADFRNLNRVYLPMDRLAAHAVGADALGAGAASAPLRNCIGELAQRAADLLHEGRGLAEQILDRRLRFEISVIHALALRLTQRLIDRDPLSEDTHLNGLEAAGTAALAILRTATLGFGLTARDATSEVRP